MGAETEGDEAGKAGSGQMGHGEEFKFDSDGMEILL